MPKKQGRMLCVPYIRLTTGATREREHVFSLD